MKIIYYYHIPKCGGTTISRQLKELAKSVDGEYYDYNVPMNGFGIRRKLLSNLKLHRDLARINRQTADFKFIHHHHGFYGIGEILKTLQKQRDQATRMGNEFYLFSSIREPLSFQKSQVNYLRAKGHLPDITFDDVCTKSSHQNVMYKYFLYNHQKRWGALDLDKDKFRSALSVMDRIFKLESIEVMYEWLESVTGLSISSPQRREKPGVYDLMPTSEQLASMKEANALDYFFYNLVRSDGGTENIENYFEF